MPGRDNSNSAGGTRGRLENITLIFYYNNMKILLIGSGGREHAIAWRLAQSKLVDEIICVPGNGGTAKEEKCRNINPADCEYTETLTGNDAIVQVAAFEQVDFAVVGPEDPLCSGIADQLWSCGIPVVGPKQAGAMLEGSKDTAKDFMQKYGVACAASKTFTDAASATAYIKEHGAPVVVKADGLAAGKGVVVAATVEQALGAVNDFMNDKKLGNAGTKLVIEDYLQGVEISILAAVSVTPKLAAQNQACILPFVPARDHKRLNDGAKGPNTGGMGAVAPLSDVTAEQMEMFRKDILEPTLKGLAAENYDYRGFIFFGLMLCKDSVKLLEYNVRLGDPETQAVLPLMDFDFAELCGAIIDKDESGALKAFEPKMQWKKGFQCAPVAVSGGYPGSYKKGFEISLKGNGNLGKNTKVFIAGAVEQNKKSANLVTSGGRVLAVSAFGATFEEAFKNAYDGMKDVDFNGMFYRKDIGLPGAAESGEL